MIALLLVAGVGGMLLITLPMALQYPVHGKTLHQSQEAGSKRT